MSLVPEDSLLDARVRLCDSIRVTLPTFSQQGMVTPDAISTWTAATDMINNDVVVTQRAGGLEQNKPLRTIITSTLEGVMGVIVAQSKIEQVVRERLPITGPLKTLIGAYEKFNKARPKVVSATN